ncbi:MAG: dephospho-CoA kinase [Gemella sp.]|nr:dephospho-CoA kinase [Gemella sp.]
MMRIAITGSIACGKSTVTSYLIEEKKYKVLDADKIGHELLEREEIKKRLEKEFSNNIITDDNIDRKKLGAIVFSDGKKLAKLNSIMHPEIRIEILNQAEQSADKFIFIDMALLFEAKFDDLVDKIIVVHIDKETQLERLMKRNNFSKEEALQRIDSQMSSLEKSKLADFIVDNSGSIDATFKQIDNILNILKGEVDGIKN